MNGNVAVNSDPHKERSIGQRERHQLISGIREAIKLLDGEKQKADLPEQVVFAGKDTLTGSVSSPLDESRGRKKTPAGTRAPSSPPNLSCRYSARLLLPFANYLQHHPGFPSEFIDAIKRMDPDSWISAQVAHELLAAGEQFTGEPEMGLRAAEMVRLGDFGVVEYTARSSETLGEAIQVINRYVRLVNDGADFVLRTDGELAVWCLNMNIPVPRGSADFSLGLFVSSMRQLVEGEIDPVEVRFVHSEPGYTNEYQRIFRAPVVFDARENALVFREIDLQKPVIGADAGLNLLLRRYAEDLLKRLPKVDSFIDQVRNLVISELRSGSSGADRIAGKLHMSERTLRRRLQEQGTTHRELVDDLRRRLAISYLESREFGMADIAFLLGFSQASAFNRAFRRWTGSTPGEFRANIRSNEMNG